MAEKITCTYTGGECQITQLEGKLTERRSELTLLEQQLLEETDKRRRNRLAAQVATKRGGRMSNLRSDIAFARSNPCENCTRRP